MKPMEKFSDDPYSTQLFEGLLRNEDKLCGEYAVFYHSYSHAAPLYEVNAAIAASLFRFRSDCASLPRLLARDFAETPGVEVLMEKMVNEWQGQRKDHITDFRRLAISAMCSLVATGPECCLQVCFRCGYSCKRVDFGGALELTLAACGVPADSITTLATEIVELSHRFSLDTSQFLSHGGQSCASESPGHILQLFVHRSLLDKLCYPAIPYGEVDRERLPFSQWVSGDTSFSVGQARLLAHPGYFLRRRSVRMFLISADESFQSNRKQFQAELARLLSSFLATGEARRRAATGICGVLPSWWSDRDQTSLAEAEGHDEPSSRKQSRSRPTQLVLITSFHPGNS